MNDSPAAPARLVDDPGSPWSRPSLNELPDSVFDSDLCAISRWLPTGEIVWASSSLGRILGTDPQLLVDEWAAGVPGSYMEAVMKMVATLTPEQPRYVSDAPLDHPDGTRTWARCETVGHFCGGELQFLQTVAIDITEERRAAEAAQASERRLMSVLEHLEDVILLVDGSGRPVWVCPRIQRQFGDDTRLATRSMLGMLDATARDELRAAIDGVSAAPPGSQHRTRFVVATAEGGERAVDLLLVNMTEVPGVEAIVIHARDVTDREIASANATEVRLRGLLSDIREFVLHIDALGWIGYASSSFVEHFGRSPLGLTLAEALGPHDEAELKALLDEVRANPGRKVMARVAIDLDDGRRCWVGLTVRRVVDTAGEEGLVVVGQLCDGAADAHLAVVAEGAAPARSTPDDIVDQFESMSPADKLATIAALRSRLRPG